MNDNDLTIPLCGYFPRYDCPCRVNSRRYELQYVSAGGVALEFGGLQYRIEGGGGWLIHPGVCYTYRPLEKYGWWEHRYVVFDGSACARWKEAGILPEAPWSGAGELELGTRLDRVMELSRRLNAPLNRLEATNLLEKIFIDLRRLNPTGRPPWLDRLLRMIATAPKIPDYGHLAAVCGMSRRTLFRRFQAETGLSPHRYYLSVRASAAVRLLETTDLPIKDIAARLGYADPAHFARQFKAVTGKNPGELRSR